MMEKITTLNGLVLEALFIKHYENCKLFFCQDRMVLTNIINMEIVSIDILLWIDKMGIDYCSEPDYDNQAKEYFMPDGYPRDLENPD